MESRQYTFNKSTLTVKFGDILDSQAEVIASSDDCYVTMGGGVSDAILRAGGDSIIKDARKMVPVPLGDVISTTAGTLAHQKYVFHCITIDKKRRMQIRVHEVTEEDVLKADFDQIDFRNPIVSSNNKIDVCFEQVTEKDNDKDV